MPAHINNISIREYFSKDKKLIEDFRKRSFEEGNDSLTELKYDPDNIKGKTWMTFIDGSLASISVCEASCYTGDPDIAARICRYHILKKYRHCNAGFRMLPYQVDWAKRNSFKVIYWTQDMNNKSLNALYQRRKKMPGKSHFFESELYKSFNLQKDFLFKVSPKSDFLQYIYSRILQTGYVWIPKTNVISIPEKRWLRLCSEKQKMN